MITYENITICQPLLLQLAIAGDNDLQTYGYIKKNYRYIILLMHEVVASKSCVIRYDFT